jgi:hypothetical protein
MNVHRIRDNPGGRPPLVCRELHWPQLAAAMLGGDQVPVVPDLAVQLVDMRDTVTRVINNLVAGIDPSSSDWLDLTDKLGTAHLLWCISRRGTARHRPW